MTESSESERFEGPWRLIEKLGRGGNATVWRARREGEDRDVALKVINSAKATAEPYRRFVREVEFLRGLGSYGGVLPLLDAHLPGQPSNRDRAWLAMPVATPIDRALDDAPLETVVEATAMFAETLTRLADEHGLGHRDVKPGNLYELDMQWLVGDFGLIDLPDVEELTRSGRPLGPAHFTAYEVVADPTTAASGPADVFSLGKTLWVLATGNRWPPDGHQPAATPNLSVRDLREHPKAELLDRLIDSMTRLDPAARPAMKQVGQDLRAWLELSVERRAFDVAAHRAAFRDKLAGELASQDLQEERKELALAALRSLNEQTKPLNGALRELHPRAQIDRMDDKLSNNTLQTTPTSASPAIEFSWVRCSSVSTGPDYSPFALRMGRGLELTGTGELLLRWMIDVGPVKHSGSEMWVRSDDHVAPVGSVEQERTIERFVDELGAALMKAIEVFVEKAPAP